MNFRRLLGIVIAVCAVAVLAGSIGAGAAPTPAKRAIDLSTNTGVREYLRSVGISPRRVVIQRAARNYAGAHCPGKSWSCTSTKLAVVQVAAAGGKNTYSCTGSSCAVIQVAAAPTATNTAKCIKTTGLSQTCTINQSSTSANNVAIVLQTASKMSGLTQSATYTAQITQRTTGASAFNKTCVRQQVNLDGSTVARRGTPVSVNLAAHQTANVTQDSATGDNFVQRATTSTTGACDGSPTSPLTQTQTLTSTATGSGPITQNQNSVDSGPNMALDIKQNKSDGFFGTATGKNFANFDQTNTLSAIANTPVGPVNQTQSSANGGILATVNQDSRDVSTANATQTETQCEDAHTTVSSTCDTALPDPPGYSLTQTQVGPVRKGAGDSVQTGNEDCVPSCNLFTVTQTSNQDNDTQDPDTQTNLIQGDCTTSGNCMVTQTTNIDGTSQTNTESGQNVDTQTTCSGSTCTSSGPTTTGDLTLLPDGLSVSNADVAESGYGGMRGSGTGSITVSGVSAPVLHAFLYWNGPTNSTNPTANAAVTFNGTPVTGTNIGVASSNCWPFTNSQSYRADVTPLVTGSGSYTLADFMKPDADINGVALIVFYDNGNSGDDRTVVLWNGNDSNVAQDADPAGWDETITGVPYPGSGAASLDFVVSDGQQATDDALVLNGDTLVPTGGIFEGDTTPAGGFVPNPPGSLWDVEGFDITSFLSSGSNTLHLTTGLASDCLSLVVAAANVPASAPVILGPAAATPQRATTAPRQTAPARTTTPSRGFVGAAGVVAKDR
jgi:hypothetical protein